MAKPIVGWMGGKRRLAKHILPHFPDHRCYVEAFAGGAALFFMRPEPAEVEVINDINGELINLYRVVQCHLEEFVRQFKWALISREMFEWQKRSHLVALTDIQRAARFYYLQQCAFGARGASPAFGYATTSAPKLNLLRIEEALSIAHVRLARCYIERLPWQDCIKRYDREHTLFYFDPPYWDTAGYGVEFPFSEYEQLAQVMTQIKGKAVLSINDHPDIRRVFKGMRSEALSTRYTVGGGAGKEVGELLVFSW